MGFKYINKFWKYIGVDIEEGPNVDVILKNPYIFKFSNNSIDVIVSCCTFEHINWPWLVMQEIYRVLKSGGYCCIIAPFNWPEHKHPIDCYRFFPDGYGICFTGSFSRENMPLLDSWGVVVSKYDWIQILKSALLK